ncbi:MAG: SIMPL domain-containing protein [Methanothrix sp.]|nr:SIMPL domain-containing protein [Methanothrix sp.]
MKLDGTLILGIVLIVLTASPSLCQDDNISKIIVQGEGRATAPADRITVVLGVEVGNPSAAKADSENARLMNETIAALLSAGVAESEIQTSSYSLSTSQAEEPFRSETAADAPEFIATNMVRFNLNLTRDVGGVLDAALSSGSNRIQEISFDLIDPRPQRDLALTRAIEDAGRKAETAARAAGVSLGRILEISEGYGYVAAQSRSMAFDPATSIRAGDMEVTASVTITYEIA